MVEETLRLSAHEKFIIDGIKRQAGKVEKAILELVMNAIEAQLASGKKPKVWIIFTVDDNGNAVLVVRDLGRGFKNRLEVEEWFAKFGTPHDECPKCKATMVLTDNGAIFACNCGYETEGRTWAEFRMGRGQAFSYGRNVWRTGKFCMEYDLETPPGERSYAKGDGNDHVLDFRLQSGLPNHKGCEVTVHFYENPVGEGRFYRSFEALKEKIKHHVEFMEGEILFNDEQINTPASECKWDMEDDNAYYMFGKGLMLALYNLGAFVTDYSADTAGVTGVVVSKRKLMVNFARNDVLQSCEVYQRLWDVIRANKIKKVRNARRRLEKHERISTLRDMRDGDVPFADIKTFGLVELTNGTVMSLDAIRRIRSVWTFAPPGDQRADHLMQGGKAICFSEDVIHQLSYSGDEQDFFDWLLQPLFDNERSDHYYGESKSQKAWGKMRTFYRPFYGVSEGISDESTILPTSKLTPGERRFLRVMEGYNCWNGRTLCIGLSQVSAGWTDGTSYIAFSRNYLRRNRPDTVSGAAAMITLAFHEKAHDESDEGTHVHSVEFYKAYHDLTYGRQMWMIGCLPERMSKAKWEDQTEKAKTTAAKAKKARDTKLGLTAKKKKTPGITHEPDKPRPTPKPKRKRIKRF